jgi:hypothetical protein
VESTRIARAVNRRSREASDAEAALYQGWIANRRRAEAILAELEELSARAAPFLLPAGDKPERPKAG